MKIEISGKSVEEYSKSDTLDEFRTYLESIEDAPILLLDIAEMEDNTLATEGLIWSAVKGTGKAIKASYKGVKMANGAIKTGIRMAAAQYRRVMPVLMKSLQNTFSNLELMWGKYMQYDKRFKELGRRMTELVTNHGARGIRPNTGKVTFRHHKYSWAVVLMCCNFIEDFKTFCVKTAGWDTENDTTGLIKVDWSMYQDRGIERKETLQIMPMKKLMEALQGKENPDERIEILDTCTRSNNDVIAFLNSAGLIHTISVLFTQDKTVDKQGIALAIEKLRSLWKGDRLGKAQKMLADSGNTLSKVIQQVIQNFDEDIQEITFNNQVDISTWIEMKGNFCDMMNKYLNSGKNSTVISEKMKKGGVKVKTVIQHITKEVRELENHLVNAIQPQNDEEEKQVNDNAKKEFIKGMGGSSAAKSTIEPDETSEAPSNPATNGPSVDQKMQDEARTYIDPTGKQQEINGSANENVAVATCIQSYSNIIQILAKQYQGIVQGLLLGTYTMVEEGESICDTIDQLRGSAGPVKKGG